MPAILAAVPAANLVVAGEGPDRADAERARDRSGVAERIHLAGHLEDPGALLAIADVFVNPALAESFSYGILEAMAHGCACVVTDAGGSAEAITPASAASSSRSATPPPWRGDDRPAHQPRARAAPRRGRRRAGAGIGSRASV